MEFVWPAGVRSFTKKEKETDPHTQREETTGLEREWPGDKKKKRYRLESVRSGKRPQRSSSYHPNPLEGGVGWAGGGSSTTTTQLPMRKRRRENSAGRDGDGNKRPSTPLSILFAKVSADEIINK